jgi:subtilase family serine protease
MTRIGVSDRLGIRFLAFVLVSSLLLLPLPASGQTAPKRSLITQPIDESKLTILKGNTHPLARHEFDHGAAPLSLPMERMLLVLKRTPEQESALASLLDQQQDKSSPNYHNWLTPQQFGQQFGPSDSDIETVTTWLQSHGFQVAKLSNGRVVIEFSGTAEQVQESFHTSIHKYSVDGKEHWANSTDPQIPAALAPVVTGIASLHNFVKKPHVVISDRHGTGKVRPGSSPQIDLNGGVHAVGPSDYAIIYNFGPLYGAGISGAGLNIAVVGRSNLNVSDVQNFRSLFGLSANFGPQNIILNGPDPGNLGEGEEVEAVLDVSWSGTVGRDANILFVVSESTETTDGVDLSEVFIIDNNIAGVMTESFGSCEQDATAAFVSAAVSLAQQAAAQGITFIASSGDSGAVCTHTATETIATQLPASLPFVTAVGGTMFNENGNDSAFWSATNSPASLESALQYIPEGVWNESARAGGPAASSGGTSTLFSQPVWQTGVQGIPNDGQRHVPDVSLNSAAFHDPAALCVRDLQLAIGVPSCVPDAQGQFGVLFVGGTSAAAPSFAGIMVLVDQSQGNTRQGEAGYVLYKLAAAEQASPTFAQCNASALPSGPSSTNCVFNDVTVGNNVIAGEVGSTTDFQAGTGYDLATGLGSVNAGNLINAWGSVRPTGSATAVSSVTTFPITHSQSATFTISVSPQAGNAVPAGNVSLIAHTGSFGTQTVADFPLTNGSVTAMTSNLPGGQYTVTAHYEGDGTLAPSDSQTSVQVNVRPETSSTQIQLVLVDPNTGQITNNVTSTPYGSNDALRVDVSASLSGACPRSPLSTDCPTGNVTITSNTTPLDGGTFLLNSLGYVEDQVVSASLSPGNYHLSASYVGDSSFAPSGPALDTITITQATTTTSVSTIPTSITSGGTITLTALVVTQSFGTPPSGTVTFFNGGAQLGNPVPITGGFSNTPPGFAIAGASLTTTLSNLPSPRSTWRRKLVFQFHPLSLVLYVSVLWLFLRYVISRNPRVRVYATLTLVLLFLGGIAACGGGGGGGNHHTDTITAKFSGDINYSSSTSAGVGVMVQ